MTRFCHEFMGCDCGPEIEKLQTALSDALDVAIWMSGSDDFGPQGKAAEGWETNRERLWAAIGVLSESRSGNRAIIVG